MQYATVPYNRRNAVAYAKRWALGRNPLYENYAGIGGDCTNFISQCILAGCCEMNFTPIYGWYYLSPTDRTASWTGVSFFYNFITQNQTNGPFATEREAWELMLGDVIQLGSSPENFYHTLIVTGFAENTYLVAAHTNDSLDRPLDTYNYNIARFLHIEGVRVPIPDTTDCFEDLISGTAIPGHDLTIN